MYSFGHLRFCCILRRVGASVVRAPLRVEPVDGDGEAGTYLHHATYYHGTGPPFHHQLAA